MKSKRDSERELREFAAEETFHRREWLVQRIGWIALATLLIAACAGLLGNGPLAHDEIAIEQGVFKFDRLARRDGPTEWIVRAHGSSDAADFKLVLSSSLLQRIKIQSITPAPQEQLATAKGVLFMFHSLAPEARIVFHLEPQFVGWTKGEFQLNDSRPAPMKFFVYP